MKLGEKKFFSISCQVSYKTRNTILQKQGMDISVHIIYLHLLMSASLMSTPSKSIQREGRLKANGK